MEQNIKRNLEALNQIYEMIDDIYDSYAASFHITDVELCVLYALSEHNGDYLQTDICRSWYCSLRDFYATSDIVHDNL